MSRYLLLLATGLVFQASCSAETPANEANVGNQYDESRAREALLAVDKRLNDTVGIGLRGVSLMLSIRKGDLLLLDSLLRRNQYQVLRDLERSGFLDLRQEHSDAGDVIEVIPTDKGTSITNILANIGDR